MSDSAVRADGSDGSATQSTGTITWKSWDRPSTTVARTQPLVVVPQTTTVSTPSRRSRSARSLPKKADGARFSSTVSPSAGSISGSIRQASLPRRLSMSVLAFSPHTPASGFSGSYPM